MDSENPIYLSCRTPANDARKIDKLVSQGIYVNRSDFMRTAIRELLQKH